MKSVYLAGPIVGETYEEAYTWRRLIGRWFKDVGIEPLSPMRDVEHLDVPGTLPDAAEGVFSSQRGLTVRDFFDCRRADVIFANLLCAETVSKGTLIEIGFAAALGKPVVLVMEEGNLNDHPMLREIASYRFDEPYPAFRAVASLLNA